jgi:threonine/homoserine/homoserine lactone efflux protein
LPAAFAPLLSDGPVALLVLLVLNQVPDVLSQVLRVAGGLLLLYLAWAGYRQWQRPAAPDSGPGRSTPRTLIQAVGVNLLNPNPYLGWSLVLGPAFLNTLRQGPWEAAALIIAFYATMVVVLAGTIFLFGATRFLGPHGRKGLVLVSAGLLAVLGVYQLGAGVWQMIGT